MQELQREQSLFTAPTLPRKTSWLQRYYFLSRWATPFLLLGCICILVLVWEMLPLGWLSLVLVLLPLQGILLHLFVVRVLAHIDLNKRQTHKLVVDENFLTIFHSTGEIEQFPLARLARIRWIYSGFHKAFRKEGKYFNGNKNQLSFTFQDSKRSIHFQLLSRGHMRQFRDLLARWYETDMPFEEFNQTSGLPLQSHLLVS